MGTKQSLTEYSADNLKTFEQSYYQIKRNIEDARFGLIDVYLNKTYKNLVWVQKRALESENDFSAFLQELKIRQNFNHKNISPLTGYQKQQLVNVCGKTIELTMYGEFHEHDLQKELNKRMPAEDYFTEAELWYLAESIVSACAYLESFNIYHGDLRPIQIILTEEGFSKIADHGLVHPYKNSYVKAIAGFEKCFLSPEQLVCYGKQQASPNYNVYKADVYSLGMTFLYISTFKEPLGLYNFYNTTIDHDKVENRLEEVLGRYSPFWTEFVRRMLLVDPEKRMTFLELSRVLYPYQTQIRNMQNFSQPTLPVPRQQIPIVQTNPNYNLIQSSQMPIGQPNYNLIQSVPAMASPIRNSNYVVQPQPQPNVMSYYQSSPQVMARSNYEQVKKSYDDDDIERRVEEAIRRTDETIKRNAQIPKLSESMEKEKAEDI